MQWDYIRVKLMQVRENRAICLYIIVESIWNYLKKTQMVNQAQF